MDPADERNAGYDYGWKMATDSTEETVATAIRDVCWPNPVDRVIFPPAEYIRDARAAISALVNLGWCPPNGRTASGD